MTNIKVGSKLYRDVEKMDKSQLETLYVHLVKEMDRMSPCRNKTLAFNKGASIAAFRQFEQTKILNKRAEFVGRLLKQYENHEETKEHQH